MKRILIVVGVFILCLFLLKDTNAQRIEYQFKKNSDVNDSIRYVINEYKKTYKQTDVSKINLFASIDYCDGYLNLYISNHSGKKSDAVAILAKKTNRYILIDGNIRLPLILATDILSKELFENNPVFIKMNGYYIKIERNEQQIWKVAKMNMVF